MIVTPQSHDLKFIPKGFIGAVRNIQQLYRTQRVNKLRTASVATVSSAFRAVSNNLIRHRKICREEITCQFQTPSPSSL